MRSLQPLLRPLPLPPSPLHLQLQSQISLSSRVHQCHHMKMYLTQHCRQTLSSPIKLHKSPQHLPPIRLDPSVMFSLLWHRMQLPTNIRPDPRPQTIMSGPQRHTHTAPSQAPAASAIDLEAQNSVTVRQDPANTVQDAADSTISDAHDTESDWEGNEPSDVAAERARVDALWTTRQSSAEGIVTGSSSQPAILLHNLRKVSISVHRVPFCVRSGDIVEILSNLVICLPVCLTFSVF